MPVFQHTRPGHSHQLVYSLRTALLGAALATLACVSPAGTVGYGSQIAPNAGGHLGSALGAELSRPPGSDDESAEAVALQPDGKIIVVGSSSRRGKNRHIVIQRLNPDGSLDQHFGASGGRDGTPNGMVSLDMGDRGGEGRAVRIQPDGKILIAGHSKAPFSHLVVARLDANGRLDRSFGTSAGRDGQPRGVATVSLGEGEASAHGIVLDHDGHIVLLGTASRGGQSSHIAVARLKPNGRLDTRFGAHADQASAPSGVVRLDLGQHNAEGSAVRIQPDGKILIAGHSKAPFSHLVVARLNANGRLDKSFGAHNGHHGSPRGVTVVSLGEGDASAHDLAQDRAGRIVVVGTATRGGQSSHIAVVRLTPNGSLDTRFGAQAGKASTHSGVVSLDTGHNRAAGRALLIQPDGKILVAGHVNATSNHLVVARLGDNGRLDKSYGGDGRQNGTPDGIVQVPLGQGDGIAIALALQRQVTVILVGDLVPAE